MTAQATRGRPRDQFMDEKILRSAVDLLSHKGFEAMTIEAVAAKASVSRPAIYRRYPNREALVVRVAETVFTENVPPVRSSSSPRDEVLALLENTVDLLTQTPAGAVFRNLIPYLDSEPAFSKHANAIGAGRRKALRRAVVLAITAGELPEPANIDRWLDQVLGAVYFRFLITGRSLSRQYIRSLVDDLS